MLLCKILLVFLFGCSVAEQRQPIHKPENGGADLSWASARASPVYQHTNGHSDPIAILRNSGEYDSHGTYKYEIETANGITRGESGQNDGKGQIVSGFYSYPGPDGKIYTVRYTADENGFHPEGDHLPKQGDGHQYSDSVHYTTVGSQSYTEFSKGIEQNRVKSNYYLPENVLYKNHHNELNHFNAQPSFHYQKGKDYAHIKQASQQQPVFSKIPENLKSNSNSHKTISQQNEQGNRAQQVQQPKNLPSNIRQPQYQAKGNQGPSNNNNLQQTQHLKQQSNIFKSTPAYSRKPVMLQQQNSNIQNIMDQNANYPIKLENSKEIDDQVAKISEDFAKQVQQTFTNQIKPTYQSLPQISQMEGIRPVQEYLPSQRPYEPITTPIEYNREYQHQVPELLNNPTQFSQREAPLFLQQEPKFMYQDSRQYFHNSPITQNDNVQSNGPQLFTPQRPNDFPTTIVPSTNQQLEQLPYFQNSFATDIQFQNPTESSQMNGYAYDRPAQLWDPQTVRETLPSGRTKTTQNQEIPFQMQKEINEMENSFNFNSNAHRMAKRMSSDTGIVDNVGNTTTVLTTTNHTKTVEMTPSQVETLAMELQKELSARINRNYPKIEIAPEDVLSVVARIEAELNENTTNNMQKRNLNSKDIAKIMLQVQDKANEQLEKEMTVKNSTSEQKQLPK